MNKLVLILVFSATHMLILISYLGLLDPDQPFHDILFQEAFDSDTQRYLRNHTNIKTSTRFRNGAVQQLKDYPTVFRWELHCDLRLGSFLFDNNFDLMFCEFAGSLCDEQDGANPLNTEGICFKYTRWTCFTMTGATEVLVLALS